MDFYTLKEVAKKLGVHEDELLVDETTELCTLVPSPLYLTQVKRNVNFDGKFINEYISPSIKNEVLSGGATTPSLNSLYGVLNKLDRHMLVNLPFAMSSVFEGFYSVFPGVYSAPIIRHNASKEMKFCTVEKDNLAVRHYLHPNTFSSKSFRISRQDIVIHHSQVPRLAAEIIEDLFSGASLKIDLPKIPRGKIDENHNKPTKLIELFSIAQNYLNKLDYKANREIKQQDLQKYFRRRKYTQKQAQSLAKILRPEPKRYKETLTSIYGNRVPFTLLLAIELWYKFWFDVQQSDKSTYPNRGTIFVWLKKECGKYNQRELGEEVLDMIVKVSEPDWRWVE